jgi:predicted nucleic acid-binding protein
VIVVDTSAVLDALLVRPRNERLIARLADDGDLHAPHLVDVEFLHVLRRLVNAGKLDERSADQIRSDFERLALTRYPSTHLLDRMWELRTNLSAYDAAFVALAEVFDVVLITSDGRIARSPGHRAHVEVFAL